MHSTDMNRPLLRWLRDNVESARCQLAKSEPIRYEVERLQVNNFLFIGKAAFVIVNGREIILWKILIKLPGKKRGRGEGVLLMA